MKDKGLGLTEADEDDDWCPKCGYLDGHNPWCLILREGELLWPMSQTEQ